MNTQEAENNVQVGDVAPDFVVSTQDGKITHLSDFRGEKAVVVYFYPKDDTPGCTAEACTFRDSYEEFKEAGAEVIGISSDDAVSHQQFASKYHLPFTLVSDEDSALRKLYGVKREDTPQYGLVPGRVTYVIDKEGIVRLVFSSVFAPKEHITEALKILK